MSELNPDSPDGQPAAERRRRARVSLVCEARQGLQPWSRVRLDNFSAGGFRLVWPNNRLDPRQPLRLRVQGLQLLSAEIRWVEGAMVGCAFTAPLHEAVFEHFANESRRQSGR